MYKLLLCWRYLFSRYIALASIVSVMLGVATMIVVNSVMDGFTSEMRDRIHGILSDMVFESRSLEGFPDPEQRMQEIREVAGELIAGMTPTVMVPGMINFQFRGNAIIQQVQIIGIDERTQGQVSDFSKYLQHAENRKQLSFHLRDGGYDTFDHQAAEKASERKQMETAGWKARREMAKQQEVSAAAEAAAAPPPSNDPFRRTAPAVKFDPSKEQFSGVVMGIALACHRDNQGEERFVTLPGEDIQLTFPTAGSPPKAAYDKFTIVDFYESKMSEYDASFVFVPIAKLQELRGMIDPTTGARFATAIQIRLKPGADLNAVRDRLRAKFPAHLFGIYTWQDKQGPLLAAVHMETAILNVLLFLIIAVAGFGILAVFFMIVVEKTRDIGILKSLGASSAGIMGIFLSYGLSLGIVGSGVGLAIGLAFVHNINGIADLLAQVTGQKVFDPQIYYFYRIPTIIDPPTIAWIMAGALGIAVLASVAPAIRAAMLHPVEALRYE